MDLSKPTGVTNHGTLAPDQTISITWQTSLSTRLRLCRRLLRLTPPTSVMAQGTAGLNGQLNVTLTGGPFIVGTQYTLLLANGGLNGTTFSNVSISAPPGVNAQVTYDTKSRLFSHRAEWLSHSHAYWNSFAHSHTYFDAQTDTDAEAASNSAPPALTRHMIPERCCRALLSHFRSTWMLPIAANSGLLQRKRAIVCLFRFRIFAYSVHGRLSQPFPSFLSQLGGGMQRELLLHAHLMCLNRFNAYMQFSR